MTYLINAPACATDPLPAILTVTAAAVAALVLVGVLLVLAQLHAQRRDREDA